MTDAISWRTPKVLRVLVLVFVAGALSGAVTYKLTRKVMHTPPPLTSVETLKRELHLTPVQSEQVAAIIDDYKRYYGNIQDQVEEIRATGKSRILQVLDPDQRSKFEKLSEGLKY